MTSRSCCGCWSSIFQNLPSGRRTGGRYRKVAKYNEREYTIEFENLIEEEDFYAPPQHAVSQVERDLLAQGQYGELMKHQKMINDQQDAKLRQDEEDARLEDEAYILAKKEASLASRQAKKQVLDKERLRNIKNMKNEGFTNWLSKSTDEEALHHICDGYRKNACFKTLRLKFRKYLDIEDFDSFLEKVKTNTGDDANNTSVSFEQTLSQGVKATRIAGDALNALQPVELQAVSSNNTFVNSNDKTHDTLQNFDNTPVAVTKVQINTTATTETALTSNEKRQSFSLYDDSDNDDSLSGGDDDDDGDDFVSANSHDAAFEELLI